MESKMECILASIFDTFQWILGGKLGGKIYQKSIQKGIGKRIQKKKRFLIDFGIFLGGGCHAAGMASRGLSDPLNQTPLELGNCLGLGKGKRLCTGKHRHMGKGKDTSQVGRMTHSHRRAERGGGYYYYYYYDYYHYYYYYYYYYYY